MSKQLARGRATESTLVAVSAISLLLLALAYAAIDDITTDRATSFTVEYTMLVGCGVWMLAVAALLTLERHYIVAFLSISALFAAGWGLRDIRHVVSRASPEFIAVAGAFLWFSTVTAVALWRTSLALRRAQRSR